MSFNIAILLSVEILPTEIKEPVCKKTCDITCNEHFDWTSLFITSGMVE